MSSLATLFEPPDDATPDELRARLRSLADLVARAPVPIAVAHDPGCRLITANDALARLLHVEPAKNISMTPPAGEQISYRIQRNGRDIPPGDLPMQYAVAAALTGDRSHQVVFRKALAERARVTTESLNAIPGMRCVAPRAAFYALPSVSLPPGRTDEDYVLALLRETGILCVHGSGFGTAPEQGYFRIVFLADPVELAAIYADMGAFTAEYLRT